MHTVRTNGNRLGHDLSDRDDRYRDNCGYSHWIRLAGEGRGHRSHGWCWRLIRFPNEVISNGQQARIRHFFKHGRCRWFDILMRSSNRCRRSKCHRSCRCCRCRANHGSNGWSHMLHHRPPATGQMVNKGPIGQSRQHHRQRDQDDAQPLPVRRTRPAEISPGEIKLKF